MLRCAPLRLLLLFAFIIHMLPHVFDCYTALVILCLPSSFVEYIIIIILFVVVFHFGNIINNSSSSSSTIWWCSKPKQQQQHKQKTKKYSPWRWCCFFNTLYNNCRWCRDDAAEMILVDDDARFGIVVMQLGLDCCLLDELKFNHLWAVYFPTFNLGFFLFYLFIFCFWW